LSYAGFVLDFKDFFFGLVVDDLLVDLDVFGFEQLLFRLEFVGGGEHSFDVEPFDEGVLQQHTAFELDVGVDCVQLQQFLVKQVRKLLHQLVAVRLVASRQFDGHVPEGGLFALLAEAVHVLLFEDFVQLHETLEGQTVQHHFAHVLESVVRVHVVHEALAVAFDLLEVVFHRDLDLHHQLRELLWLLAHIQRVYDFLEYLFAIHYSDLFDVVDRPVLAVALGFHVVFVQTARWVVLGLLIGDLGVKLHQGGYVFVFEFF